MGGLLKILFDILKEPLGLPLNIVEEYIILALIEFAAYKIAFEKTGIWGKDFAAGDKSLMHWTIRTVLFVVMWAVIRFIISVYGLVINHKILSLVIASIAIIVVGIIAFAKYKRRSKMPEEMEEDDELE